MPNYNQAPMIKFDIPKEKGNQYYELPQHLMDRVFAELGNSSAQLRVMIVLIGTKPGFSISEQWVLDRTGLTSTSYSRARSALIEKGWISLIPSKEIRVNFKTILSENSSNMKAGLKNSSNMVLGHSSNMVLGIIDKEQINNKYDLASQESLEFIISQKKEKGSLADPIPVTASKLNEYNIPIHNLIPVANGMSIYKGIYFKPIKETFNF